MDDAPSPPPALPAGDLLALMAGQVLVSSYILRVLVAAGLADASASAAFLEERAAVHELPITRMILASVAMGLRTKATSDEALDATLQ